MSQDELSPVILFALQSDPSVTAPIRLAKALVEESGFNASVPNSATSIWLDRDGLHVLFPQRGNFLGGELRIEPRDVRGPDDGSKRDIPWQSLWVKVGFADEVFRDATAVEMLETIPKLWNPPKLGRGERGREDAKHEFEFLEFAARLEDARLNPKKFPVGASRKAIRRACEKYPKIAAKVCKPRADGGDQYEALRKFIQRNGRKTKSR